MLYFAYGSNLDLDQMAWRCPGAEMIGPGVLHGYKLAFRGPLDIERAQGSSVPGFIFDITDSADWESLDAYEGFPYVYDREKLRIEMWSGRRIRAITYIMTERQKIRGQRPPGYGYLATVRKGYKQCGLGAQRGILEEALKIVTGPTQVACGL